MTTLDRLRGRLQWVQFELYDMQVEGEYREDMLLEEEGLCEEIAWLEFAQKIISL